MADYISNNIPMSNRVKDTTNRTINGSKGSDMIERKKKALFSSDIRERAKSHPGFSQDPTNPRRMVRNEAPEGFSTDPKNARRLIRNG